MSELPAGRTRGINCRQMHGWVGRIHDGRLIGACRRPARQRPIPRFGYEAAVIRQFGCLAQYFDGSQQPIGRSRGLQEEDREIFRGRPDLSTAAGDELRDRLAVGFRV